MRNNIYEQNTRLFNKEEEMRKITSIGITFLVIVFGTWLLTHLGQQQAESVLRQQSLRQLLAPAGANPPLALSNTPPLLSPTLSEPVVVNMANLPPATDDSNSMYNRWLRGELDLSENEGRLSQVELDRLRQAALALEPDPEIQQASETTSPLAPVPGTAFDSLDYTDSGGFVPPDPELAAGPSHVIAVVNTRFAIYNTSGTELVNNSFTSFFASLSGCNGSLFDPNVLYDEATGRYILGIDRVASGGYSGSAYCIGVSASGDPTGNWYLYRFAMNNANANTWMDYPHAGVGRDAIYMGGNIFSSVPPISFQEGRVWAFDKAAMYAGNPAGAAEASLGDRGSPQPLNLHGYGQGTWPSTGPHYIAADPYDGNTVTLYTWNNALSGGSLALFVNLNLETATGVTSGMPVNTTQQGGNSIQANDWRTRDLEYRNGYGWLTDSISCNAGGSTVNCVRWAQVNLAAGTITQAGVYASDNTHRIFPNLAVNHCNDMAVGYTKSSSSMFPGVWYTGRLNSDPAGALQSEAQLKAGEVAYTAFDSPPYRWGDYTGMTIAPNGLTFWYLGEYSKNLAGSTRWGNYIGSFTFPTCTIDPPPPLDEDVYLPYLSRALPTATPTATPPPVNVLQNGDFEQGQVAWQEYSTHGWQLILPAGNLPVPPQSGSWAAWLGGDFEEISYVRQQVAVPAGNSNLVFWYWIASEDICGYDFGGVIVNDNTVVDVFDLCASTSTGGWVSRSVNLAAYGGQTIQVEIRSETDSSLNSNLFVDNVSLGGALVGQAWSVPAGASQPKSSFLGQAAGPAPAGTEPRLWPPTSNGK